METRRELSTWVDGELSLQTNLRVCNCVGFDLGC